MSVNIAFVDSAQSGVKQEYWNLIQLCNEIFKQFTEWHYEKARLGSIFSSLYIQFMILEYLQIQDDAEVHLYENVLIVKKNLPGQNEIK